MLRKTITPIPHRPPLTPLLPPPPKTTATTTTKAIVETAIPTISIIPSKQVQYRQRLQDH